MSKGEFYKMEFDAWDEGTVELTLEEEGAYLRLCHQMYRRRGPIPNSDRMLCALWRCHQNKARPLLQKLITKGKIQVTPEGNLTNGRVRQEVDTRETLGRHRADAGHTGGIRSGHARRKSLENNNTDEAKRSRGDKIRGDKTLSQDGLKKKAIDEAFDGFWSEYPKRAGDNPKAPARKAYDALIKSGVDPGVIIAGLRKAIEANRDKIGTQYIPQAVTWLKERRFEQYTEAKANGHADEARTRELTERAWRFALEQEAKNCGVWQSRQIRKSDIPSEFIKRWQQERSSPPLPLSSNDKPH